MIKQSGLVYLIFGFFEVSFHEVEEADRLGDQEVVLIKYQLFGLLFNVFYFRQIEV
jgi:hypothetical protein